MFSIPPVFLADRSERLLSSLFSNHYICVLPFRLLDQVSRPYEQQTLDTSDTHSLEKRITQINALPQKCQFL
jgi:hypothetical protein